MDGTKNLNPQLKEIYDRIMNTNVARTSKATTPTTSSAVTSTPATPVSDSAKATLSTPQVTPASATSSEGFVFSSNNKLQEVHADNVSKTNVNGQPLPTPTPSTSPAGAQTVAHKGFLSGKIIVLLVIFIFVWTFFWLIFLGVIGS